MFELTSPTPVTIANVNVRSELHGDEHVPAADVAIKLTAANTILYELDAVLRVMLYKPAEDPQADTQPELDGVEPVSDLPLLRCTMLEPIRLKHVLSGYTLTIDRGLGGPSNIVLRACSVDKFKADCRQGGSVELSFRAQASNLDEATLGRLATMIGSQVEIMLEAPEEAQAPIDGSKDGDAPRAGAWPFPGGPDGAGGDADTEDDGGPVSALQAAVERGDQEAGDDFKNARSFEKAVKREMADLPPLPPEDPPMPIFGEENRKSGEVLPMGTPRTARGRAATRAHIAAHLAQQGDGAVS